MINHIYGLLLAPERLDFLDTNIANQFTHNREAFDRIAREWTINKANKSVEQLAKGIEEAENSQGIPEEYKCALTRKIMEDPVICLLLASRMKDQSLKQKLKTIIAIHLQKNQLQKQI